MDRLVCSVCGKDITNGPTAIVRGESGTNAKLFCSDGCVKVYKTNMEPSK